MTLSKTHKACRKALKNGLLVSFDFNNTKQDILILKVEDIKTGKLLDTWARYQHEQSDSALAAAVFIMIAIDKKRRQLEGDTTGKLLRFIRKITEPFSNTIPDCNERN